MEGQSKSPVCRIINVPIPWILSAQSIKTQTGKRKAAQFLGSDKVSPQSGEFLLHRKNYRSIRKEPKNMFPSRKRDIMAVSEGDNLTPKLCNDGSSDWDACAAVGLWVGVIVLTTTVTVVKVEV